MLDVRVVVNYFGNPPHVFPLWLDSCGCNEGIKWLFFTDIDMSKYHVPANMVVIPCDFKWMKSRIQSKFSYPVRYSRPWDFCALKPLIGTIFAEELGGADFWGWSDIDMLYGDLSPVIRLAEDGYDKIMPNGHFSIIRNTKDLNRFIMEHPCTRKAVAEDEYGLSCYDERDFRFTVMYDYGARQASEVVPYIHLYPRWGHFKFNVSHAASRTLGLRDDQDCPVIFTWQNGHLLGHFAQSGKAVRTLELAYVHFFKRNIGRSVDRLLPTKQEGYLIVPNGIRENEQGTLGYWTIRWLNRPRIHWKYVFDRLNWATLKRKMVGLSKTARMRKKDEYSRTVFHRDC